MARNAGKNLVIQRWGRDDTVLDDISVAGTAFGEFVVFVVQQDFGVALAMALLEMHDVTEQRNRLDVAAIPAHVATGGAGVGLDVLPVRYRRCGNFEGIAEQGRLYALGVGVMSFAVGATGNVQVNTEIAVAVLFQQRGAEVTPLFIAPVELDLDRVEAISHP